MVKHAIYMGIIFNILFYCGTTIAYGVMCMPASGVTWVDTLDTDRCYQSVIVLYLQAAFGVISDFYILILPMPILFKLNLPTRKKASVAAIFMTGIL